MGASKNSSVDLVIWFKDTSNGNRKEHKEIIVQTKNA